MALNRFSQLAFLRNREIYNSKKEAKKKPKPFKNEQDFQDYMMVLNFPLLYYIFL